jgi:hypothetical protein
MAAVSLAVIGAPEQVPAGFRNAEAKTQQHSNQAINGSPVCTACMISLICQWFHDKMLMRGF